MVTQVTLLLVLDENINPEVGAELDAFLALISEPENGVRIERRQESTLLSLQDIEVFMATQLPRRTPGKRVREVARQFYTKLPHWSQRVPLRLVCPFCYFERGRCRCARMGWNDYYGGSYRDTLPQLAAWLLDPQSVRELTDLHIAGIHAATGSRLAALRRYLTG